MNWKKNVITKKARQYLFDAFRRDKNPSGSLLVNSIPKSGTHLLTQIVDHIGLRDYGGFIANTPSFTLKKRDEDSLKSLLSRTNDQELMSSHLFYSEGLDAHIAQIGMAHLFIIRDPRDIFLSEINYLSKMNRWHKMSGRYKGLKTFGERFELCLLGVDVSSGIYYPDFKTRVSDYAGWVNSENVYTVRYEDLRSDKERLVNELVAIGRYLSSKNLITVSNEAFAERALLSIDPEKSHTFSKGKVGSWREKLSDEQAEKLESELSAVTRALGYK